MRRPCADREEKRVTYGNDLRQEEQLDPDNPNQRGLSAFVLEQLESSKSFMIPCAWSDSQETTDVEEREQCSL